MNLRTEIIWAKKCDIPLNTSIRSHSHMHFDLFYILSGNPIFQVGQSIYSTSKGSCIIVPPKTTHMMMPIKGKEVSIYEVKFLVKDEYIYSNLINMPPLFEAHEGDYVRTVLSFIITNYCCHDTQNIINIDYFFSSLITFFFISKITLGPTDSHYIITDKYNSLTREIIVYLEANYLNDFSLENLARSVKRNSNYICAVFKKNTKYSIVDYLHLIRIRQAVIHLSYNDFNISETAYITGFAHINHFCRMFKRYIGVTPIKYRKAFPLAMSGHNNYDFSKEPIFTSKVLYLEEAVESLKNLGKIVNLILSGAD